LSGVVYLATESPTLRMLWWVFGFVITWMCLWTGLIEVLERTKRFKHRIKSIDDKITAIKEQNQVVRWIIRRKQ